MTTISTRLKSVTTIENAAPWANEQRVLGVVRDLPRAEVVGPVGRLLLDLDALEAMGVEPVLEAVDVLLGAGLPSARPRR